MGPQDFDCITASDFRPAGRSGLIASAAWGPTCYVSGGEGLSRRTSPGGGEARCGNGHNGGACSIATHSLRRYPAMCRYGAGASQCALDRQAAIWKDFPMAAVGSAGYRSCASSDGGDIAAGPAAARPVLVSMSQGPC
jgi:hypothetical protein